jgi:hypothetical protein
MTIDLRSPEQGHRGGVIGSTRHTVERYGQTLAPPATARGRFRKTGDDDEAVPHHRASRVDDELSPAAPIQHPVEVGP